MIGKFSGNASFAACIAPAISDGEGSSRPLVPIVSLAAQINDLRTIGGVVVERQVAGSACPWQSA